MSLEGTAAHRAAEGLPPLVAAAVGLAERAGFALSCLPEHGRLLALLAGGVPPGGVIGETGTGCGVGLAWLATGAGPDVRVVSVERDEARATAAAALFADVPSVEVVVGDWTALAAHGPFALLALDGGGQGKGGGDPFDPATWLVPGGTFVVDDLTPATTWPPTFEGAVDTARTQWHDRADVTSTELRLRPDAATLVATWTGGLPRP